jgi:hypothetical protein
MVPWLIITGFGLHNLLTLPCTILISINLKPTPSFLTAEDSLHSYSLSTTDFWFTTGPLIYVVSRRIHRRHNLYCWQICLPRRCLAIDDLLVRTFASTGMCLAIRCLAMGMARTTRRTLLAILILVLRVRISGDASKMCLLCHNFEKGWKVMGMSVYKIGTSLRGVTNTMMKLNLPW